MIATVSIGFDHSERQVIADMFWAAFGEKLRVPLGHHTKAIPFIAAHLQPSFAITARDEVGTLVGVAGFKTEQGGLIGGTWRDLFAAYGLSAVWRGPLLDLFERPLVADEFLLDGIFVATRARGQGVGSALIEAAKDTALEKDKTRIRLDVIDTNPRAHALYKRHGFYDVGHTKTGLLRPVLGFKGSTQMAFDLFSTKPSP